MGLSVERPTTYSSPSRLNSSPALGPPETTSLGPLKGVDSGRAGGAAAVLRPGRGGPPPPEGPAPEDVDRRRAVGEFDIGSPLPTKAPNYIGNSY
jgi:hypothetical protein